MSTPAVNPPPSPEGLLTTSPRRARSTARLLGEIALALTTMVLGAFGVIVLAVSTNFGGGGLIALTLFAAAAATGAVLAGLLGQDAGRWP